MKRILVVDDEAGIRRSLRLILERAGYAVTEARNGQEAVRLWRDRPGHLVITDIHMPEKDGIETILELRALTPAVRIIAMSGGVQTKHLDLLGDAVLVGAVATLEKPFSIQAALDAVRAILTEPQDALEQARMTTPQPFTQVDAFTDQPFAGNPAAVCLLPAARGADWMQQVAREMNLAETAFLVERSDGFDLRWFTPACEVDLCGHATLASAHVLWQDQRLADSAPAHFHTRSGLLTATRADGLIWLDFPATPPAPAEAPPDLARAIDAEIRFVGRTPFDYLVEVGSEAEVRGLRPDLSAIERLGGRGVMITAASTSPGCDFVSRFFAPAAGVPEDPVTGSAHCALGPFWGERLGRRELVGYQASARGGTVRIRLAGPRVLLGGHAVIVLRGELYY